MNRLNRRHNLTHMQRAHLRRAQSRRKSARIILTAVFVGGLLLLVLIIYAVSDDAPLIPREPSQAERDEALEGRLRELDRQQRADVDRLAANELVDELTSSGVIHSYSVQREMVRVDPLLWSALPIETKEGVVIFFSRLFKARGRSGRVDILSNRNDQKLASYSNWSGMKIIK